MPELRSTPSKERREALNTKVRPRLRTMSRQEVFERCLRHGVPCGKFLTCEEALADPQVLHNAVVEERLDPAGGRFRAPRPPARFSRTPAVVQGHAPTMGADTDAVLQE